METFTALSPLHKLTLSEYEIESLAALCAGEAFVHSVAPGGVEERRLAWLGLEARLRKAMDE